MSHNSFGHLFRVTTFGESHGLALGAIVDGCPPRLPLSAQEIQVFLDKRRPGQSRYANRPRVSWRPSYFLQDADGVILEAIGDALAIRSDPTIQQETANRSIARSARETGKLC